MARRSGGRMRTHGGGKTLSSLSNARALSKMPKGTAMGAYGGAPILFFTANQGEVQTRLPGNNVAPRSVGKRILPKDNQYKTFTGF